MPGINSILQILRKGTTTEDRRLEGSVRGGMFVQKDLPDYTQLVNENAVWSFTEASAVAAVTAVPTTTAQVTLYNNEASGGKSYVIMAVFGTQVGNGAALNSWHLMHLVQLASPTTRPTQDIARASIGGHKTPSTTYGGNAIIDLAATVVDDLWKPIGPFAGTTVASLTGTSIYFWMHGSVILAPGGEYSLVGVASATGITTRLGMTWAEVQL